jgi:hypothetical protein
MRKTKNVLPFLLTLLLLLAGCGYSFSPGGEYIDKDIRTVYVETFANRTSEANIEATFRSAFIDQFRKSSRFKLADRREDADAVLKGSINNLSVSHLSYSTADVAKEDRATVTMELVFEERKDRKIIWSNSAFSWYGDFSVVSTDTLRTEVNKRSALDKLATDLADRAYRLIMSGF